MLYINFSIIIRGWGPKLIYLKCKEFSIQSTKKHRFLVRKWNRGSILRLTGGKALLSFVDSQNGKLLHSTNEACDFICEQKCGRCHISCSKGTDPSERSPKWNNDSTWAQMSELILCERASRRSPKKSLLGRKWDSFATLRVTGGGRFFFERKTITFRDK